MSAMWFAAGARVHHSDGRAYPSSPQMFLVSERGLHSRAHVYVQNVFGRRAADGGLKSCLAEWFMRRAVFDAKENQWRFSMKIAWLPPWTFQSEDAVNVKAESMESFT